MGRGKVMWKWSDLKRLLGIQKAESRELAAIMWPAVYPSIDGRPEWRPREPHCTILILGDINTDLGFTKEDVLDAIAATYHSVFLWAKVHGLEWFGSEQNIPVLRVHHDYLAVYQTSLMHTLSARGITWDDTYPEYKPHISITPEAALDGVWPKTVLLSPVELWWGGEHIQMEDPDQITAVGL